MYRERPRIVTLFGTRPEAIKLAPVVAALRKVDDVETCVVTTAQHREMLDQVLSLFNVKPDVDLDLMTANQTLAGFMGGAIADLTELFDSLSADLVLVQGDTTTAAAGALAGLYTETPVAHVEAGLRSHDLRNPFPEEANRRLISQLAELHLAATSLNRDNLIREGCHPDSIHVTGNPVIDSLHTTLKMLDHERPDSNHHVNPESRVILVTLHRRESLGEPLAKMCGALADIVNRYPDVEMVFPVHPNPAVVRVVRSRLASQARVHLVPPLDYASFVGLMRRAFLIISDSGGVQEEAPSLHTPLLITRETTERPEVVEIGAARLVGRRPEALVAAAAELLDNDSAYQAMVGHPNPFGDGHAADRIVQAVRSFLGIANESGSTLLQGPERR